MDNTDTITSMREHGSVPAGRSDLLLDVRDLHTHFYMEQGTIRAVEGVSFSLARGESIGIVGESGCGKSVTARSIMKLLPHDFARIVDGQIIWQLDDATRTDIAKLNPYGAQMRRIRGGEIAMIFQEPMTSLNPVYTIGEQIVEAIVTHTELDKDQARERAIEMLDKVKIPEPAQRFTEYQHQFSGGMRQRAMIAMALACDPRLLIADEPTTALYVTIESQILALMQDLQDQYDTSMIMISHDLNVVGEMVQNIIVMYLGHVVERTDVDHIFDEPKHPYTQGLLRALPNIGRQERLVPIKGSVPNPYLVPSGCPFSTRCEFVHDRCLHENPPEFHLDDGTSAKCWLFEKEGEVRDDA